MSILKRGLSDTWRSLGGVSLVLFVVAIPLVGLGLHYLREGAGPMNAEFENWLIYGLAATGLVFIALLLFNMACAPYRLEVEAHGKTREERDVLIAGVSKQKDRSLSDEQKASLADAIKVSGIRPETISVTYDSAEAECADFAADIGDAIEMAGINPSVHDGILLGRSVRDRGVKLYVGKSAVMRELCDAFFKYFTALGFPPERRDAESKDNFFIDIARRSKN